ncbi:MAG TPA: ATP-binding protein [Candidatus Binataceae bacterium]|nr:ATP-binding protein [Candidatus Binataceae bacterium]
MIKIFAPSIPRRILAALLTIYLLTYSTTAIVVYSGVRESILESDAAALNRLADLKYQQLADLIGALARDLTAWSELEVMNDLASGDVDKRVTLTLEALNRLYGLPGNIYAFDASGKLLASSRDAQKSPLELTIPTAWQDLRAMPAFVDQYKDPVTGDKVVVLSIPVFASFDHSYRIGTLALTYPWSSIDNLLVTADNESALLEDKSGIRLLSADPADLTEQLPLSWAELFAQGKDDAFVIGRSAPREGLIQNWRFIMLHSSGAATRPLRWIAFELLLLGLSLGVPIVLFGRWLSHRLTAPIADLTRVVSEIADTDKLDARVPVTSSDELGSLARSFNRMTDNLERTTQERERFVGELAALNQTLEARIAERTAELEAAMRAQRRLIGDISHEIKSPLARLSMALGLASRSADPDRPRQFARIEREIENISALASELLTLARLDGTAAPPEFAPVPLHRLIKQVIEDAVYEAPPRARDIAFRSTAITVPGNADLLKRAIENVMRNAIFYTSEGTPITVSLSRKGSNVVSAEVADCGPGVPEAALKHLFEPFYRVDTARARQTGGAGVGLAICQRVVQLHGGAVHARNNDPHGLIVTIDLPIGASSPGRSRNKAMTHERGLH